MNIAVVVPAENYWSSFITDLRRLWVPDRGDRHSITIGNIRYLRVNSQFEDQAYGHRVDKVLVYNHYSDHRLVKVIAILSRHGAEVVYVWN